MEWAATSQAAGGHAALAATCATEPAAMARVLARLRGQLDGRVIPAATVLIGSAEPLGYRTCTLLTPRIRRRRR